MEKNKDGTFAKGHSGGGRKKGSLNVKTQLERLLNQRMSVLSPIHKDELGFPLPQVVTLGEHMAEKLIAKALGKEEDPSSADLKAIDMIYDRLEGKAVARTAEVDDPWKDLIEDGQE